MIYNPEIHHRRSIRLHGYDYTQPGAYFITLCTHDRECLFGDVFNENVLLNELGQIVKRTWQWLGKQYGHIQLDAFIVMPNHLHGIIKINCCRGGLRSAPTERRKPLGQLIGAFKTVSTKQINQIRHTPGIPVWQRNYYEHIIRNENEMNRIREYVIHNSSTWETDRNNPEDMK